MRRRNIRKVEKRNRAGDPTGGFAYRARYEGPDGKERTRHFKTKKEANRWLDEQSAKIVTGTYVDPNAGKVTFHDYAEEWRDRQVHRPATASDYEVQLSLNPPLAVRRGNAEMPFCLEKMGVLDTSRSQGEGHLLDATVTHTGGIVSVV